jgi:hypothetical protein
MATAAPTMAGYLEFDAATHTYRLDGELVPSVTTVLKSVGLVEYSHIPQDVLQAAAHRGTAVHTALEYLDRGELDWTSLDPTIKPYVVAYERFLEDSSFIPAHIEYRVFNGLHRYAGTLDRTGYLGNFGNSLTVLDFKTGLVLPGHAIQLAAYANCLVMPRRFRRIALQLCGDGTYRVHEYPLGTMSRDIDLFLAALACHNFKTLKEYR